MTRIIIKRPTAEEIKAMSREEREQRWKELVPGLRGKALTLWICTGKSSVEQMMDARAAAPSTQAISRIDMPEPLTKSRKRRNTKEEASMPTTTKTKQAQPKATAPKLKLITTKEIADAAGVTPKQLRVYLRAEGVATTEGRYQWKSKSDPAARKVITGVKRFVKEQAKARAAKKATA